MTKQRAAADSSQPLWMQSIVMTKPKVPSPMEKKLNLLSAAAKLRFCEALFRQATGVMEDNAKGIGVRRRQPSAIPAYFQEGATVFGEEMAWLHILDAPWLPPSLEEMFYTRGPVADR